MFQMSRRAPTRPIAEIQQAPHKRKSSSASSSISSDLSALSFSPTNPPISSPSLVPHTKLLFLTVGTTQFDDLVNELNQQAERFVTWLLENGFDRVVMQIGTGKVEPTKVREEAEKRSKSSASSSSPPLLRIDYFRDCPDLIPWVTCSSLVISHAGAGSIMESLRLHRPLLVVINTRLMHNHQSEVARALEKGRYLYQTEPKNVCDVLEQGNWNEPIPEEEEQKQQEKQSQSKRGDSSSSSSSSSSYQLIRYPPIDIAAFPMLLDQHAAELSSSASASLLSTSTFLTLVLPFAVALGLTATLFR